MQVKLMKQGMISSYRNKQGSRMQANRNRTKLKHKLNINLAIMLL